MIQAIIDTRNNIWLIETIVRAKLMSELFKKTNTLACTTMPRVLDRSETHRLLQYTQDALEEFYEEYLDRLTEGIRSYDDIDRIVRTPEALMKRLGEPKVTIPYRLGVGVVFDNGEHLYRRATSITIRVIRTVRDGQERPSNFHAHLASTAVLNLCFTDFLERVWTPTKVWNTNVQSPSVEFGCVDNAWKDIRFNNGHLWLKDILLPRGKEVTDDQSDRLS